MVLHASIISESEVSIPLRFFVCYVHSITQQYKSRTVRKALLFSGNESRKERELGEDDSAKLVQNSHLPHFSTHYRFITIHVIPKCTVLLICSSQLLSLICEQLIPMQRVITHIPVGFMLLKHTVAFVSNYQSKQHKFHYSIGNPVNCCNDALQVQQFPLNCSLNGFTTCLFLWWKPGLQLRVGKKYRWSKDIRML